MLEEQITKDYVEAMKARDKLRSSTLNFLRAELKNVIINEKKETLSDDDVIGVIKKQVKQRQDSIEQFKSGGRDDLVEKEQSELEILKSYMPEEISADKLEGIVSEVITETGASSMKDMGSVMKAVLAKVGSSADNKIVSEIVKNKISQL